MSPHKPKDERGAKAVQWSGGGYQTVTRQRRKASLEIKRHPHYPATHSVVIVTTGRGLVFACDWAGTPNETAAWLAWEHDRRSFKPYDTSTGHYVGGES